MFTKNPGDAFYGFVGQRNYKMGSLTGREGGEVIKV